MFDWIIGNVGELRTDITTGTVYRYNGTEWIVNKSGTPSRAAFPTAWNTIGDVREDILTWFEYRWNGSAWVLITKAGDTDEDGTPNTVEDNGITTPKIANNAVTYEKMADDSVSNNNIVGWSITANKLDIGVLQVSSVNITSAEILVLNTTPKVLIPATWEWSFIDIDKIVISMNYNSTAYTTNTTLAFSNWQTEDTVLLNTNAKYAVSIIDSLWAKTINWPFTVTVSDWNPVAWDSDINIKIFYRILSI